MNKEKDSRSFCFWFTGLSGSGKSTLAKGLYEMIEDDGFPIISLDGDQLRSGLNVDLCFSNESRIENIRRTAEIIKIILDSGVCVVASFISPTKEIRELAKMIIGPDRFVEIFVKATLEECMERDPKGLYRKALNGELKMFTGIDSIYENPINPNLVVDTCSNAYVECIEKVYAEWRQIMLV